MMDITQNTTVIHNNGAILNATPSERSEPNQTKPVKMLTVSLITIEIDISRSNNTHTHTQFYSTDTDVIYNIFSRFR